MEARATIGPPEKIIGMAFCWRADSGPFYYIYKKDQEESAHMCRPINAFATLIYTWIKIKSRT